MRAQLLWNHFHSLGSRFMGSHNFSGSFEGYFVGSVMEIPLMNIKQMIVIKFVGMLIHGQRLPLKAANIGALQPMMITVIIFPL